MHYLLEKLFKKRGINGYDDLTTEEKADFERTKLILSKEELTMDDIKEFCQVQIEVIKGRWQDYGIDQSKKAELIPYFTVYNTLLNAINSPKLAREAEERRLTELLKE